MQKQDYKKQYLELFNAITDAIELLKSAQARVEQEIIADERNQGDNT